MKSAYLFSYCQQSPIKVTAFRLQSGVDELQEAHNRFKSNAGNDHLELLNFLCVLATEHGLENWRLSRENSLVNWYFSVANNQGQVALMSTFQKSQLVNDVRTSLDVGNCGLKIKMLILTKINSTKKIFTLQRMRSEPSFCKTLLFGLTTKELSTKLLYPNHELSLVKVEVDSIGWLKKH